MNLRIPSRLKLLKIPLWTESFDCGPNNCEPIWFNYIFSLLSIQWITFKIQWITLGEECVEKDRECCGGEERGHWVSEAEDSLLLVIGPGQLAHHPLQLHQERPEQWHEVSWGKQDSQWPHHHRWNDSALRVRQVSKWKIVIYFLRCMSSVGVFGKGLACCLFGEESRFTAKSSISSMIVSMSKCDVFLDSFLLAAARTDAPFTTFLFMFSAPLLLLSSLLALCSLPSSPDSAIGLNTADFFSDRLELDLSKSSLTVVRLLFWETWNYNLPIDWLWVTQLIMRSVVSIREGTPCLFWLSSPFSRPQVTSAWRWPRSPRPQDASEPRSLARGRGWRAGAWPRCRRWAGPRRCCGSWRRRCSASRSGSRPRGACAR